MQGALGLPGIAGPRGIACWDLNQNGQEDADEDINSDGLYNPEDCPDSVDPEFACGQGDVMRWNGDTWGCQVAPFESTDDTTYLVAEFFGPPDPSFIAHASGKVVSDHNGVLYPDDNNNIGFDTSPFITLPVGGGVMLGVRPFNAETTAIFALMIGTDLGAGEVVGGGIIYNGGAWSVGCAQDGTTVFVPITAPTVAIESVRMERYPEDMRFFINEAEVERLAGCQFGEDSSGRMLFIAGGPVSVDYFVVRAPRNVDYQFMGGQP